jgi:hypothetical protein
VVVLRSDVLKHPKALDPEPGKSNRLGHIDVAVYLAYGTLLILQYVCQSRNTSFVMCSAWKGLTQIGVR